jgi:hypothetical protein
MSLPGNLRPAPLGSSGYAYHDLALIGTPVQQVITPFPPVENTPHPAAASTVNFVAKVPAITMSTAQALLRNHHAPGYDLYRNNGEIKGVVNMGNKGPVPLDK